jgi:hypothetical protein
MKPVLAASLLIISISLCQQGITQPNKTKQNGVKVKAEDDKVKIKDKGANDAIVYPYTAAYSSQFEMGKPEYAKIVLDAWKDFDDNSWDHVTSALADSVVFILADGTVIKGKESAMAAIQEYRGSLSSVVSTVQAWITTRSIDKDEYWVSIWGDEVDTKNDGTNQTTHLNEIWRFNKDGKVDLVRQYAGQPEKEQ